MTITNDIAVIAVIAVVALIETSTIDTVASRKMIEWLDRFDLV